MPSFCSGELTWNKNLYFITKGQDERRENISLMIINVFVNGSQRFNYSTWNTLIRSCSFYDIFYINKLHAIQDLLRHNKDIWSGYSYSELFAICFNANRHLFLSTTNFFSMPIWQRLPLFYISIWVTMLCLNCNSKSW